LGFANSSAYERWWEARKLWGALVNTARSFARQVVVLINDNEISDPVLKQVNVIEAIQKDIVKSIIAFVYLFKNNLRHTNDNKHELELYLSFEEINYLINQFNKPNAMLVLIERKLTNSFKKGYINNFYYNLLSTQLVELTNIMGGCERINSTPIPFPYKVLVNRLVLIFCYALPFSLVKTEGIFAPFVILLMSYALFGLAALIDELEMPFGYETNDLPLEAISRMIEINLLQVIGEVDLPNFKTPNKDGILL
jgi:putative membrane protein